MTNSPALDLQLRIIGRKLADLQAQILQVQRGQRTAQLANASVENGSITFYDAGGTPAAVVGLQPDGTFAHVSVTPVGPPQPPDQPLAGNGVLSVWTYWDGLMADGSNPLADFAHVEVHCSAQANFTPDSTTLQGIMTKAGLFGIGSLSAGTTYYITFVAVNQAGNTSGAGLYATATAESVPANITPGSISALELQTGTITAAQIAAAAGILGSQIADNTITAANILAGTIDASLLAAGIVVAGIVDATTINAATFNGSVFNGTDFTIDANGEFFYSGTPALGNIIASLVTAAGTDAFGNATLGGFTSYGAGSDSVNLFNGALTLTNTPSSINTVFSTIGAGAFSPGAKIQTNAGALVVPNGLIGLITPVDPNNSTAVETWHTLGTLPAGFTIVRGRYRLNALNEVEIDVSLTTAGANPLSGSFSVTLPAAYQPTSGSYSVVCATGRGVTAGDQVARFGITGGTVTVTASAANITQSIIGILRYPLD